MVAVIQRVKSAKVIADGELSGEIGPGIAVLLGVSIEDAREDADYLCEKLAHLRIFTDEQDKMNLSVGDVGGAVLLVPNFTLCADCRKGRRPNFMNAARPEASEPMFRYAVGRLQEAGLRVETGVFGSHMELSITNDGPVTIVMDTKQMR